jgi:4-carboxymuconolactone decarboxylase
MSQSTVPAPGAEDTDVNKPRVTPQSIDDMRADWVATLAEIPGAGLKGPLFPRNVLGTLMYNPDTFGPFLRYWVTSKLKMHLSVREQEIVILRMGMLYRCEYVWKHHVPVGLEFGLADAEIDALRAAGVPDAFSERERALVALTDEMVEHRTVRPAAWAQWGRVLSAAEVVDLIALVSQYVLFALTNNVMQVELEETLAQVPGL